MGRGRDAAPEIGQVTAVVFIVTVLSILVQAAVRDLVIEVLRPSGQNVTGWGLGLSV